MDPTTPAAPAVDEALPVESVAPEEPATSESEVPKPEPDKPRRNRRSYQERIAQLTAQARQAERERDELKASITKPDDKPPKREDFADYEEWLEAKAVHAAARIAEKKLSEAEQRSREQFDRAHAEQQQAAYHEARETLMERGSEVYEDFDDVVLDESLAITQVMADGLLLSEKGHELWYHLGKNPEVAEKIAGMPPAKQLMAIGKLEASLSGKQTSSAPKPTTTVQPRGATNNALSDNLSLKEWMKRRNEEVRKSR